MTKSIREQLRAIVTRDGKTGRIPELLEAELDDLEAFIAAKEKADRIDEVNWFIDVWNESVSNGSYPAHAVIEKHLAELEQGNTKGGKTDE